MSSINKVLSVLFLLFASLLASCAGVGPGTVARDRFDYTGAIADSWKQQMLLNIVKLRYGDAPVFLDVASVINQYSVESQVDLRLWWAHPITSAVTNSQSAGAAARYIDRPTITYLPISGEKFARYLMKPIPPPSVLSLVQAGYPIDMVFRAMISTINGIRNRYGGGARARLADPEFYPLLSRLRKIQDSGGMGFRVQKVNEMEAVMVTLRKRMKQEVDEDRMYVAEILGLNPKAEEFRVSYGSIAMDDKELAILSRSVLEVLIDLASHIEVPAVHVEEKRVTPTMPEELSQGKPVPPLIRIHSSAEKPGEAFIAVPYREHWFWISDRDMASKSLFTFLTFIFSLTETGGGREGAPVITIPAG